MKANQNGLYRQLQPRRIRLLRLNPDTSSTSTESLQEVQLDEAPPYYAFSHSWGDQARDTRIHIGQQTFFVSPELAAGIRRLQELAADDSVLDPPAQHVWIDTLCINQEDLPERSSQVRHMEDIYSRAVRTLVWLGPGFASAPAAWELVDSIYGVFRSQYPSATALDDIPVTLYSASAHAESGLPDWTCEKWLYLKQLLKLGWFSRTWVVQEVILSSQDPIILHGQQLFPWHRLEWAASWLRRNGYARLAQIPEEILNVDTMGLLRRAHTRWPLDALMSITQIKFHATDQRDKIYGLLGLAAESRDPSNLPDALVPDYTVSTIQTYLKVARYLLERNRSLAILTRTRGTSGSLTRRRRLHDFDDFPSWLPDWSDFAVYGRDIRRSLSWIDYSDVSKTPSLDFPKHFNASAGLPLKLHHTADDSVLRVEGIRVDEIVRVDPMNEEDVSDAEFSQTFLSTMAKTCNAALPLMGKTDMLTWASHFIKATTAEQHLLGGRDWDQCFRDGLAFMCKILPSDMEDQPVFQPGCKIMITMDQLRRLSDGGDSDCYAALARNFCYNRSFLVTSAGRMGIGPSDSQVGDTVAVIPGGGVPYVLRKQGTDWVFVGESYVHGIMNGEAIQGCHEGTIRQEILDIR